MRRIRRLSLALFLASGATSALAQTAPPPGGRPAGARPGMPPGGMVQAGGALLRGAVVDAATGRPVASASVAVWSRADSALVGGAVTRADGTFRVEGLRPGRYYLRVSHLGHASATTADITVAPGATQAEAPPVRLAAGAVQLEGITATAERSEVRMSADRNTYSARDMPAAAGGNATDVLRNVPAVEVDQDGRVSLRGNQNVAVQINGRAAPMRGDQLGQFLQQLPSNMVDRVEVVPNPSAKYDPEGMAGIVNIVLRGNAELGLSGGLTLSAGTSDRYNGSGNLGWQRGRVTLFGSLGLFGDGRETSGYSYRTNLVGGAPIDFLNQLSSGSGRMRSHTVNTNAELKLDGTSSLASTLMVSGRDFRQDTRNAFTRLDADRSPLLGSDDRQRMNSDDATFDGTLSYRNVVQPRQNELSVEARFNRSAFEQVNGFNQQPLDVDGTPLGSQPVRTQNLSDVVNSEAYLQADVTRMLLGNRVETGYKGQLRQVDNDLATERFSYATNAWEDTGGTNQFEIDEQVHAVYGVLTRNTGPFELQGGLRLERTDRSTNRPSDDLEPFTDLFPSALVAYNLNESRQVKASYSRRIQRPQTQLLNSFLSYEDPLNRFRGNPYLRPEYTDAFELGFQQSGRLGSLQLTPFYRHTTGAIRRVRLAPQGDTITSTVENIATADSYGADANVSLRAGRLTGFVGLNAFHQESDGGASSNAISSSGFGWSTRANANLRLSKRTDVSAFGMYRAPMNTEFGRIGAFAMTNLSLRQKLLNDKASVTVRVQDPFNTMRFRSFAEVLDADLNDPASDPGYRVDTERRFGARGVFLSFNYTFGQTPRLRTPTQQQQPQADPSQPLGNP